MNYYAAMINYQALEWLTIELSKVHYWVISVHQWVPYVAKMEDAFHSMTNVYQWLDRDL